MDRKRRLPDSYRTCHCPNSIYLDHPVKPDDDFFIWLMTSVAG
jgi:hypothetical protein